jgi:hypothetical protein
MIISNGDLLQKNDELYRVYDSKKDIVMNKVIFNKSTGRFQIYHGFVYTEFCNVSYDDSKEYKLIRPEDATKTLNLLIRKYKLDNLKE